MVGNRGTTQARSINVGLVQARVVVFLGAGPRFRARTSGEITGRVTDAAGKPVKNAEVTTLPELCAVTGIGMNALGDTRVKDADIIATVIKSLDDPDQGVRFTTAQTLRRMGQNAVLQAESALQRVALRADEAAEVKDAAKAALKTIGAHRLNLSAGPPLSRPGLERTAWFRRTFRDQRASVAPAPTSAVDAAGAPGERGRHTSRIHRAVIAIAEFDILASSG